MQILKLGLKKWQAAATRRAGQFRSHSEIFAKAAKFGSSGIFAIIAKFRYLAKIWYDCPPLTDKTVHSEVSKKKTFVLFLFLF